jgi:dolichol-phosphate mannosyltransferase
MDDFMEGVLPNDLESLTHQPIVKKPGPGAPSRSELNVFPADRANPLISIIVPCYNEEDAFPLLRDALIRLAERLGPELGIEFLLIDDGSVDSTWALIRAFSEVDSRVRGIALSRNFGHQAALTCGYDLAAGDAVVSMDADLQDPPDVILEMVEQWKKGADVVYAIRVERSGESWFKLWTAQLFYRLIRALGVKCVEIESGDFRLMNRSSLKALNRMRERHRFIRGMVGWVGFRSARVPYARLPRTAGTTKYPFRKMLRLAKDAVFSFSQIPLRLAYILSAAWMILGLIILASLVADGIVFGRGLNLGHTILGMMVSAFGAMIFLCLGILGEYVGRIYEQSQDRPLYLIKESTGEWSNRQQNVA